MKIYYNSKIAKIFTVLNNCNTVMLFGAVFTEKNALSPKTEYHEATHVIQYKTLFMTGLFIVLMMLMILMATGHYSFALLALAAIPVFLFYVWYWLEYVVRFAMYWNSKKAYKNIVFEREAMDLESECDKVYDVFKRKSEGFSFLSYYGRKHEWRS